MFSAGVLDVLSRLTTGMVVSLTLASQATAQQTWNIAAQDLPAAILAAAPGDVLLVSGVGFFQQPLLIDKPLHIHGQPGAQISSVAEVAIEGIAAGQAVTLQNFAVSGQLSIRRCAGTVLLSDIRGLIASGPEILIDASLDTAIANCHTIATLRVSGSSLTVADSQIAAPSLGTRLLGRPSPALIALNSHVRLSQSTLVGGSSEFLTADPYPAAALDNSTLRVSGADAGLVAGVRIGTPVSAVIGNGSMVLDPAATLTPSGGAGAIGTGIVVTRRAHPTTSLTPTALGAVGTITLRGTPGDAGALLFGLPTLASSVRGVVGELRLAAPALITIGQLDASGRITFSFTVPSLPLLRGLSLRWQGITSDAVTPIWAEPATECHF
ncbi:MAG: hypothetical protein R3F56_19735 [Planctomycetota bacterium]